jgi:cytochrome c peroxidase
MTAWRRIVDAFAASNVINASGRFVLGAMLISLANGASQFAMAQSASNTNTDLRAFAAPMIKHAQDMRRFNDHDHDKQDTPRIIPQYSRDPDPAGFIASFQPSGRTFTDSNAFFQDHGTNSRTCFSCHQADQGWSITPEGVAERFRRTQGRDPIFRLVDGAVCPTADVSTLQARQKAFKLVIEKGLIRVGLAIPATAEYEVVAVKDPYNCNTNPATGLQGTLPTNKGVISVYRRPLPIANVKFLSTVMWDGREPRPDNPDLLRASLETQANDATLVHAQADGPLSDEQKKQIVDFELGLFTAQDFDFKVGFLNDNNAKGNPVNLSMTDFFVGINDPLGLNPQGTAFTLDVFGLYRPWLGPANSNSPALQNVSLINELKKEHDRVAEARRSIALGEQLFNGIGEDGKPKGIDITGVGGLNDNLKADHIPGGCGTCHDTPNVGNHSVTAPLNIGITMADDQAPPALDISGLPVFTFRCVSGLLADPNKLYKVTDPGRALISGKCADIGKTKGPILRGLASRAPYFHNGSARTLMDAVNFYNQRFHIGFTDKEKADLVAFLNTL